MRALVLVLCLVNSFRLIQVEPPGLLFCSGPGYSTEHSSHIEIYGERSVNTLQNVTAMSSRVESSFAVWLDDGAEGLFLELLSRRCPLWHSVQADPR